MVVLGLEQRLGLERQMGRCGAVGMLGFFLLFFNSLAEKKLEIRKEERVRERLCASRQFSRTHKNEFDPRK